MFCIFFFGFRTVPSIALNDVNSKSKHTNTRTNEHTPKRIHSCSRKATLELRIKDARLLFRYSLFMIKVNRKLWANVYSATNVSPSFCPFCSLSRSLTFFLRHYIFSPINVLIHIRIKPLSFTNTRRIHTGTTVNVTAAIYLTS